MRTETLRERESEGRGERGVAVGSPSPQGSPATHAPGGSAITDAACGGRRPRGKPQEPERPGELAADACALRVSGVPPGGPWA